MLSLPRVRDFLNRMVEGDSLIEAADKAGIRRTRARLLMRNPTVRKAFTEACEVLRDSERARNIRLAVQLRDDGMDTEASAAAKKVALDAARYLDGDKASDGPRDASGVPITPGLLIVLTPGPDRTAGTYDAKPLIVQGNER